MNADPVLCRWRKSQEAIKVSLCKRDQFRVKSRRQRFTFFTTGLISSLQPTTGWGKSPFCCLLMLIDAGSYYELTLICDFLKSGIKITFRALTSSERRIPISLLHHLYINQFSCRTVLQLQDLHLERRIALKIT